MVGAEHDGLLEPDSVAWRVLDHPSALIGGLRALIVQSLHPLAMAGVAQHSDYQRRPLERLRRTAYYVGATAMGDMETALAAAERVKRVHARVRGIDPVTGRQYSAEDPETQVWVHTVEWHSFLAAYDVFGQKLTAAERDRYMHEGVRIAALLGTPEEMVPRPLRRLAGIDRRRAVDAAAITAVRPIVVASRLPGVRDVFGAALGNDVRAVHMRGREVRRQLAA